MLIPRLSTQGVCLHYVPRGEGVPLGYRLDWTREARLSGWAEPQGSQRAGALRKTQSSCRSSHLDALTSLHTNGTSSELCSASSYRTHTHTHTYANTYIHCEEFRVGEWGGGKVPANLGLPVLPLPFFPLTFTRLFPSFFFSASLPLVLPLHTLSLLFVVDTNSVLFRL